MLQIEVRKTPDGRVVARRADGKTLTPEDRELAKQITQEAPLCWNCETYLMTPETDIYGGSVWVCWGCARWA
jgi:hypothetical protein